MGLTVPPSYWNSYRTDSDRRIPLQESRGFKLCNWLVSLSDKIHFTISKNNSHFFQLVVHTWCLKHLSKCVFLVKNLFWGGEGFG